MKTMDKPTIQYLIDLIKGTTQNIPSVMAITRDDHEEHYLVTKNGTSEIMSFQKSVSRRIDMYELADMIRLCDDLRNELEDVHIYVGYNRIEAYIDPINKYDQQCIFLKLLHTEAYKIFQAISKESNPIKRKRFHELLLGGLSDAIENGKKLLAYVSRMTSNSKVSNNYEICSRRGIDKTTRTDYTEILTSQQDKDTMINFPLDWTFAGQIWQNMNPTQIEFRCMPEFDDGDVSFRIIAKHMETKKKDALNAIVSVIQALVKELVGFKIYLGDYYGIPKD